MQIHQIFPTSVGKFRLERELNSIEKQALLSQKIQRNYGNRRSEEMHILKLEIFAELSHFIHASLLQYFRFIYNPEYDVTPYVTQSWVNYTTRGEHHHNHAHPNSFLSGVFYAKADSDNDGIHFTQSSYEQIQILARGGNKLFDGKSWRLPVGTGDLLIFPSSLSHKVEPVNSDDERISLSFNTFVKGYLGSDELATGLHL